MNKLTIQHNGLTLPLKSNAEIKLQSPSLAILKEDSRKSYVLDLISRTYFNCGMKISGQELAILTNAFIEELNDFRYLTIKELEICFKNGFKEVYGEYFGLNIKTFLGWIEKYIEQDRNELLHAIKIEKPKKEISEEEKQKLINQGVIRCYNYFLENEEIDLDRIYVYEVLYDDGFLPNDKEYKIKTYNEAKEVLKFELESTKPKTREEYKQFKRTLKNIQGDKSKDVVFKAKQIVLKQFFRNLRNNKDLHLAFTKKYN